MTVSYPLTFPTIGTRNTIFRLQRLIGEAQSIYTGASQLQRNQGEWWEGEVTFRAMTHAQVGQVKGFLSSLRGKYGTFLYGDPDYLARGPVGPLGGTPLIDGSHAAGLNVINTKGWTPFTTPLLKGDYIQLGTGLSSRLHIIVNDAVTDSSGDVALDIEPRTRATLSNNQSVITSAPKSIMRLAGDPVEWSANENSIYEVSIAFREVLDI